MGIWGVLFITMVITVAVGYLFILIMGDKVLADLTLSAINKHVAKEHQEIIKERLPSSRGRQYHLIPLVLISVLNVVGLMEVAQYGMESHILLFYFTVISTLLHFLLFLVGVIALTVTLTEMRKDFRFFLPSLGEYMTDKEALFIFWSAGKEEDYESDFLKQTAYLPENLVPMFENWKSLKRFSATHHKLRQAVNGKEKYLSPAQLKRHGEMTAELLEKSQEFASLYEDMLNSIVDEPMDKKMVEEMEDMQEHIPLTQEQMAMEIRELEKGVLVSGKEVDKTTEEVVLSELRKVVESESVTANMRKEALELVTFIEERMQNEEMEQKKEMAELDASAVIQASRVFYGVSEQEVGREVRK